MPDMAAPFKLGINDWNQYRDWPSFLGAQQRADELGFDSIWTWDHVYPIVGSQDTIALGTTRATDTSSSASPRRMTQRRSSASLLTSDPASRPISPAEPTGGDPPCRT
jgi:hypothetical protein